MAWSEHLGRERTKLGAWLDRKGISQAQLHKWSGVSRPTITNLCGNADYKPTGLVKRTIIGALQRNDYEKEEHDFW
ncbi:transcriptional regulator [Paenibacillus sp. NRS-1760]|uniref:transcriptional regulator n=1 Tax=Paenibacillus sp. NRS-1760 TaxID=3233902 RepID=UPI003D2E77F1